MSDSPSPAAGIPEARFPWAHTVVVAHRGAHGDGVSENSVTAVRRALEMGALAIELDVFERDGVALLGHETSAPEAEPASPAIAEISRSSAFLVLDWKGGRGEQLAAKLLREAGLLGSALVSTGDEEFLHRLRLADHEVAIGLTVSAGADRETGRLARLPELIQYTGASAVMLEGSLANEASMGLLRSAGLGIFLWTAGSSADEDALARLRPDGIMSDVFDPSRRQY